MKKITLIAAFFTLTISNLIAQQEKGITGYDNWLVPWAEFTPNKVEYNKPTEILSGDITEDITLTKRNTYLLLGDVFVTDSTTLTIEPGTVIIGDFKTKGSLTISRGSAIIAEGTPTDPIVFTSSRSVKKPGDWGGIFILGDAPTTKFGNISSLDYELRTNNDQNINYGGENPNSFSGILKYVRIEYAGKRTKRGYFNGLTLAGVGQETIIENVMVSFCRGNSFSMIGGDVIVDKLVSYKSNLNDYDINFGTQCQITNSLAVRSPYISGIGVSRCLNVLAYDDKGYADLTKKQTNVIAENLTLINLSNDLKNDIQVGLVNEAIYIGENVDFAIDKSVISGFNPAVILDQNIKVNSENLERIKFTNTYFNNCNGNIFVKNVANNDDLENWYGSRAFNNVYSKGSDSETFIDAHNPSNPDFRLQINRIIAAKDSND